MARDFLRAQVAEPPSEFGVMPFWFWNDDLDEAELVRQLHVFHAGGVGGVVIHPRVGLSRRVGYLTETYFRLVRRVVDVHRRAGTAGTRPACGRLSLFAGADALARRCPRV